jgi:hypothetical protein
MSPVTKQSLAAEMFQLGHVYDIITPSMLFSQCLYCKLCLDANLQQDQGNSEEVLPQL